MILLTYKIDVHPLWRYCSAIVIGQWHAVVSCR